MDLISLYSDLKIAVFSQLSWVDISKLSVVCKHLVDDNILTKVHGVCIGREGHVADGLTLGELQTFNRILTSNYGTERIAVRYAIIYIVKHDGTVWYMNHEGKRCGFKWKDLRISSK